MANVEFNLDCAYEQYRLYKTPDSVNVMLTLVLKLKLLIFHINLIHINNILVIG